MKKNPTSLYVKAALVALALIRDQNASPELHLANFTPNATSNISSLGVCSSNMNFTIPQTGVQYPLSMNDYQVDCDHIYSSDGIKNLLKTKSYYRASEDNKLLGRYTMHELGNGNKKFIAIDGKVSLCAPKALEDAVKQYREDAEYYAKIVAQKGKITEEDAELTEKIRRDLENLDSALKEDEIDMPADMCKNNVVELKKYARNVLRKNRAFRKTSSSSQNPSKNPRPLYETVGLVDLFGRILSKLFYANYDGAPRSNQYIKDNINNIFPDTAKVSEATKAEVKAVECVKGSLKQYIAKNGEQPAVCVGDNVDGDYIADYISAHPETEDWTPASGLLCMLLNSGDSQCLGESYKRNAHMSMEPKEWAQDSCLNVVQPRGVADWFVMLPICCGGFIYQMGKVFSAVYSDEALQSILYTLSRSFYRVVDMVFHKNWTEELYQTVIRRHLQKELDSKGTLKGAFTRAQNISRSND